MNALILILQVATIVGLIAGVLFLRKYLPTYVAEKGKNLATKEDIAEITRQIESVKSEYAHNLEGVRAAIGSKLGIHQFRYEREYDLLSQLSEKVVELRDATQMLRPEAEYVNPDENDDDRKKSILSRYTAASKDLYRFYEAKRPFFPESMLSALQSLDQAAWREAIQYRRRAPMGEGFDPNYWDNASANAAKVQGAADEVLSVVRIRVRLWEKFEPGP